MKTDLTTWKDKMQSQLTESWTNERQDIIASGLLESWVRLHQHTTPENRETIKRLITYYDLNQEANDIIKRQRI